MLTETTQTVARRRANTSLTGSPSASAKTGDMLDMWNRVKGDNLGGSNLMLIVGIVIVVLIAFFVIMGINRNKQKKLRNRRR